MKKTVFTFLSFVMMLAVSMPASAQFNLKKVAGAATKTVQALTISDADMAAYVKESVDWMDKNNPVPGDDSPYTIRLKKLTEGMNDADGIPLNFKVYDVIDVNAFACPDGSVRVFSSLMDIMSDDELLGIIGHEIGHVVHGDAKAAIKNAYLTSAAMNAAGAAGGTAAKLSESALGDLVAAFTDAQFSQKQEYAADKYGFEFATEHGFDPYGLSNALSKLVELSKGSKASTVQKMFSSHPDSEKRSAKLKEMADEYAAEKQ